MKEKTIIRQLQEIEKALRKENNYTAYRMLIRLISKLEQKT